LRLSFFSSSAEEPLHPTPKKPSPPLTCLLNREQLLGFVILFVIAPVERLGLITYYCPLFAAAFHVSLPVHTCDTLSDFAFIRDFRTNGGLWPYCRNKGGSIPLPSCPFSLSIMLPLPHHSPYSLSIMLIFSPLFLSTQPHFAVTTWRSLLRLPSTAAKWGSLSN